MKHIIYRLFKGIIVLTAIGILLLLALYLLRGTLIAPHIQAFLENSIESQLGMDVAVGKIGGSYITNFEVADVTTLKPAPSGVLTSFELKRLRVSYNPLAILQGLNAFLDNAAVLIEAAKLEFDLSREDESPQAPPKAGSVEPLALPGLLPQIHVEDTSVFLRGPDYETAFTGISLETSPRRQMASVFQLHVSQWSWSHPAFQDGKTPISVEIEYTPEKVTVRRLKLGGSELAEYVQIGLKTLPEKIPFEARLHLAGGQLALGGKLGSSDLLGRIKVDQLDLAQVSSFFKPKLELEGEISGNGNITLPLEQPLDFISNLDLQLMRGNIYGFAADELHLQAATKDGKVHLDMLDLRTGANFIDFQNVSAASQAVFNGDLEGILKTLAGGFSFDCRDVPAFFTLAGVDFTSEIEAVPSHRLLLDGKIGSGDVIISGGSLTTDSGHIRLDPSRIALPSLSRPIKDTAIEASLDIDVPDLAQISRLFSIPKLGGALKGHVTVTGTIGAPGGTANITARGLSFEDITYGDLTAKAVADSQRAVVESVKLQREKDRLTGHGTFYYAKQELEDVQLEFQLSDLAFYVAKLWPENWKLARGKPRISGGLAGKAILKGPLTMPGGTADINFRDIIFEENRFGDTDLRLRASGKKITVETLKIRQAKDHVDLEGSFDLESQILENIKLDIDIADFAAYTKNLLPANQPASAAIQANLEASGPFLEPAGRADIKIEELQFNGLTISSAAFKLRSSGRRIGIDLARVNTPSGEAKLAGSLLRGPADETFDCEISDLNLVVQNVLLELQKPARIHFTRKGDVSIKDISLGGPNGKIQLKGSLVGQKQADFYLNISDVNGRGWFESLVTDRIYFSGLNAAIHLFGTIDAPSLTVTGDLAKLESPKDRLSLSGRFDVSYTKDGINIRQFEWLGGPGQQIALSGTLPVNLMEKPLLRPGPLVVDARVDITDLAAFDWILPDYIPLDGDLLGKLQMSGTWKSPSGTFIFRSRGLNDPPYLKSMPPGPIDADGNIRFDGNKLVVESIQINSPKLVFVSRGEWSGMPALTYLLQGKAEEPTGNVDLKGNLKVEDLSWLAAENPNLRRVSGRLEADVSMKGPISDPKVDAVVRLNDGELRPDLDVPSLQALNLNALVTPAGARLQTFTGQLGGAPFQITGSVTRNNENSADADLRIQGDNLLFYRSEGLKVRADTDLTVKGPLKKLVVAGEVAITDGRLVKYFDLLGILKGSSKPKTDMGLQLFSIRQPPLSGMVFDIRLTSKNPFTIRNNLARGAVRPELKLTGTGEFPVLAGEVYVDPTRISLPAGVLVFESGVIRFDPNRPDRPTLDLVGTSKMLGYDITMLVEGPYDEPVVTLSSVPPLTNEELLLLLIAGQQPNSTNDPQASQRQSMNVAVFLGRDLIARWFGSDSSESAESIMDRFEINVGRAVTRSGEETIDAQFRVAEDVLRDGDKIYITGEKDVFDFYNAGLKIVFRFK